MCRNGSAPLVLWQLIDMRDALTRCVPKTSTTALPTARKRWSMKAVNAIDQIVTYLSLALSLARGSLALEWRANSDYVDTLE